MASEELNQMAAQMQQMQQQAQAVANQLDAMQQSADELYATIETLKNLKAAKNRVMLPLGSGVYASSKAIETQKVLVNIGAGIVDERAASEAQELLEKRLKTILSAITKGQEALAQLNARMEALDSDARKMIRDMGAQPPEQ
ncbi:Prefoldin subunit alpha [Candidatus Anstonella stagnisolia]|nr:Prefoldin subunit alpha [Candidatus Anstonella stagnisolia]